MMTSIVRLALAWSRVAVAALVLAVGVATVDRADAHPHVWVVMKSELLYGADGAVTGVRHAWTFDDMFSTYATQGLASKQPGVFTRDELKDLAEVNVTSLKEYDFFTYAKLDGRKSAFTTPTDYWLEFKDSMLTLHFTLPFAAPVRAHSIDLEVYDPSYFVDFSYADKEPFGLGSGAAGCKLAMDKGNDDKAAAKLKQLGAEEQVTDNWGRLFANKVSVRCP